MAKYKSHFKTEAFGETKKLSEWLKDDRCKVGKALLYKRIEHGWPPEEAIGTPPNRRANGYIRNKEKMLLLRKEVEYLRECLKLAGIALYWGSSTRVRRHRGTPPAGKSLGCCLP